MKKLLTYLTLFILIFSTPSFAKNWIMPAYDGTTGGTAGKLDAIDVCSADGAGYDVQDKDASLVWNQAAGTFSIYIYDIDSAAAESDPSIIAPDFCDAGAYSGDGRWLLSYPAMTATGADAIVATATLGSVDGIPLMDGSGNVSAAVPGTNYYAPGNENAIADAITNNQFDDQTQTPTRLSLKLSKLTAAPGSPVAGNVYYADCTTWDPAGLGIAKAYYVVYDGAAYIPLYDEDGDWYLNKVQAAMNVISSAVAINLTAAQMNSIIVMTAVGDVTIPADQCDTATGKWITVKSTAAHLNSVDTADATDDFVLSDGTNIDGAANEVDLAGAAGSQATFVCLQANKWWVTGEIGTVVNGGADD